MELRIAPELVLDGKKFVTGTEAIVATKGNGKSYIAQVCAEELLEHHEVVVAIDPTDAWHGLRTSASGKRAGYPIAVFGGDHGDADLDPAGGVELALAVVEERFSCVICTEGLSESGEVRFVKDFLSTLYRKNRKPLKLIIDEADMFGPQKPMNPDEAKALSAMQNIVRRGRKKGIGCMMLTQRPSVLNKDVLSQVELLFVLGMSHPLDLAAVDRWVRRKKTTAFTNEMLDLLPEAQLGDAWAISPTTNIYQRFRARKKRTFDSGATPEHGDDKHEAKILAKVDIARLGARIAAAVERQKADDPKHLKAEVARLKKANEVLEAGAERAIKAQLDKPAAPGKTKTIEREVVKAPILKRIESAIAAGDALIKRWDDVRIRSTERADNERKLLLDVQAKAAGHFQGLKTSLLNLGTLLSGVEHQNKQGPAKLPTVFVTMGPARSPSVSARPYSSKERNAQSLVLNGTTNGTSTNGVTALTGPQRVLLSTLSWWFVMGHVAPTRAQVAGKAGWKPRGSNLRNRLSELHALGLVEYPADGTVRLTDAGASAAPAPNTDETLHDSIRGALTGPQRILFEELLAAGQLGRDSLAERVTWEPNGSNLRNRLSELSAMEIVDYPAKGCVQLQEWVTA